MTTQNNIYIDNMNYNYPFPSYINKNITKLIMNTMILNKIII